VRSIFDDFLQKEKPFPFGIIIRIGFSWLGAQSVGNAMQLMLAIEYIFVRNYVPNYTDVRIIECRIQAAFDFGVSTTADRNE